MDAPTTCCDIFGDPEGSRTPVSRVRVWCPRPLNDGVTQMRWQEPNKDRLFCQARLEGLIDQRLKMSRDIARPAQLRPHH